MIRYLGIVLFLFCYLKATSSVKDSTYFEVGFNVAKFKLMYYRTGDYNVFLQDVPNSVGQESYFDDNKYWRYRELAWLNNGDIAAKSTDKYPLNKERINFNIRISYKQKKHEVLAYIGYLDESVLITSTHIKNESIRNIVYELNPSYTPKYEPATQLKRFLLTNPALLIREDTKKFFTQFFYVFKIPIVKRLTFGICPGFDFQVLLNQATYYSLHKNIYDTNSNSLERDYYKQEKQYFKPYRIAPLMNFTLSYRVFDKFSINANAFYQIRPVWQNQNTMEVVKTSRVGVGVGLSYIIEKKKCKACPIQ